MVRNEGKMGNEVQEKIAGSYKLIMWGVLITAAHITVGRFQILPAFIGHIMIFVAINKLQKEIGIEYFTTSLKTAKLTMIASLIYWVWGAMILPYSDILTGCFEIFIFVLEISLFGEFLNKTVKLLKENDRIKQADKLRKNRMTFIKFYLGVMLVFLVGLIPALNVLRGYPAPTLMLSVKIFLSLMIQNVVRSNVGFDPEKVGKNTMESEAK